MTESMYTNRTMKTMAFLAIIFENSTMRLVYKKMRIPIKMAFSVIWMTCRLQTIIFGTKPLPANCVRMVNSNADHTSNTHAMATKPPRKLPGIFRSFRDTEKMTSVVSKELKIAIPDAITNAAS